VPQVRGITAITGRDGLQPDIESTAARSRTGTGKRRQIPAFPARRAPLIFMRMASVNILPRSAGTSMSY
jgi:hypothetical protein